MGYEMWDVELGNWEDIERRILHLREMRLNAPTFGRR